MDTIDNFNQLFLTLLQEIQLITKDNLINVFYNKMIDMVKNDRNYLIKNHYQDFLKYKSIIFNDKIKLLNELNLTIYKINLNLIWKKLNDTNKHTLIDYLQAITYLAQKYKEIYIDNDNIFIKKL